MTMEAALIDKLLTTPAITALVSTRIYPLKRLQASAYPSLVVTRISGAPLYADDGEVGLQNARVQIDSYAMSYSQAKDLAQVVRSTLSAFSGDHDGVTFSYIMLDEERDIQESGAGAAEYPMRVAMDYIVWTRG